MTRRAPLAPLLAPLLAAICLLAGGSSVRAAERTATLPGAGLSVDTPCARLVTISPDASLHGQVTIAATADHPQELDRLVFETRDTARISTGHQSCWRPGTLSDFSPTLDLVLHVPADFPISLDESGAGNYTIGPVGAALTVDLSGAGRVQADQAAALSIDLSGAGTIDLARATGRAQIDISGHGRVSITDAAIPGLNVAISGAGSFTIAHGQIGTVSLDDSGAGAIRLGAVVGTASVDVSGVGSVHFAKLTGALQKDVSGIRHGHSGRLNLLAGNSVMGRFAAHHGIRTVIFHYFFTIRPARRPRLGRHAAEFRQHRLDLPTVSSGPILVLCLSHLLHSRTLSTFPDIHLTSHFRQRSYQRSRYHPCSVQRYAVYCKVVQGFQEFTVVTPRLSPLRSRRIKHLQHDRPIAFRHSRQQLIRESVRNAWLGFRPHGQVSSKQTGDVSDTSRIFACATRQDACTALKPA